MEQDFVALQWVTGEIEHTAEQFGKALLGYADDIADQTRLRLALTHAHQIHATLRLLDVPSAAQLAQEVEAVVQQILHGNIPGNDSNLQILLAAGLQLPGYLRRVASQRRESPLDVRRLLNELRELRGESPLPPPDSAIDTRGIEQGSGADAAPADEEELQMLRRGRQKFQQELLGVLRGDGVGGHLRSLQRQFSLLAECLRPGGHRLWWRTCAAFCEALGPGGVALDERAREALREIDNEFRANLVLGHGFYARAPAAQAYRHLLSLIARSDPVSESLVEIQQRHHLNPVGVSQGGSALEDLGATAAAAEAIGGDLGAVLERLESTEGDAFHIGKVLREVEPNLRRIANMLAGLGYREEHELLQPQLERIDAGLLGGSALDDRLTEVSAALLEVDQRLAGRSVAAGTQTARAESRQHPLVRARTAVFREVQTGLDQIKQTVADYLNSALDVRVLEGSDVRLHGLHGAMQLAGLEGAAALLADCEQLVAATLARTRVAPDSAQVEVFADALSSVEYFIERLLIDNAPADLILARARDSLSQLLRESAARPGQEAPPREVSAMVLEPPTEPEFVEQEQSSAEPVTTEAPEVVEASALPEPPPAEEPVSPEIAELEAAAAIPLESATDDRLLEIFVDEASAHLGALREYLAESSEGEITEPLMRLLHTLRGSSRVAGVDAVAEVLEPLEEYVNEAGLGGRALAPAELELLGRFCDFLQRMLLQQGMQADAELSAQAARLSEECRLLLAQPTQAGPTAQLGVLGMNDARLARFLEDSLEKLFHATTMLESWSAAREEPRSRARLLTELDAIHQRATQLDVNGVLQLSGPLLEAIRPAAEGRAAPDAELFALAGQALEAFLDVMDRLAAGQLPETPLQIIERLRAHSATHDAAIAVAVPSAAAFEPGSEAELQLLHARVSRDLAQAEHELLEIFMVEAEELMASIDESIDAWRHERRNREPFDNLQRHLHTLKGGARMAGLKYLGELSHNFETFLINENVHFGGVGDGFFEKVADYHEQLMRTIDVVKQRPPVLAGAAPEESQALVSEGASALLPAEPELPQPPVAPAAIVAAAPLPPIVPRVPPAPVILARPPPAGAQPPARPRDEVVRVSAQLLEDLVNLAGETSISRGRVEEQVSELGHLFEDMQGTVERLQGQVRRLDIATEAQVLFRHERADGTGMEGFDPLEMDRYSQLQQLSRSLVESASDVLDIKRTLAEKTRDLETVLIQQSRINSELQEGLMRSRMVPFASILPRLKRVVRQVSGELGKRVELELGNLTGELDRGILERVVAPLEHMLRNAVDHGIEPTETRRAAGKPPSGRILIEIAREGGDVLIAVADDGAGVNLDRVRARAIERGLMEAGSMLSDHEVLQFILHSGFSTAARITQVSGRGVGMDVVRSEIRLMGGSLEMQTDPGHGSRFLIRLPFTVSVSRALMVDVGSESYALPLNTVEGVVRMYRSDLARHAGSDAVPFDYAGRSYEVRYLGSLLHPGELTEPGNLDETVPVVLVRGGGQTLAVVVERLVGAREVVVKGLGPQFGAVPGLSGATVLGDGSVVLILDIPAMLRADAARGGFAQIEATQAAPKEKAARVPLIMVVDDSVTVRKVTSRLLERAGMRVCTAKDGADAMVKLVEQVPDLVLLDIEMPHMDGFEVLSKVRLSEQLKRLPIIMITSRTGDKHRERALSLGANLYLGKPYQESVLMDHIHAILGLEPR